MQEFHIIGITDSRELSFSKEVQALIARSHVFSGGKRHHEIVAAMLPESSVWLSGNNDGDWRFFGYTVREISHA